MQGLDEKKALAYMAEKLNKQFPGRFTAEEWDKLVEVIYEGDLAYMRENHVLDEEDMEGDAYYDDDEAFEFIMDVLTAEYGLTEETEMPYAEVLDHYMDLWEQLLEKEGLISWD